MQIARQGLSGDHRVQGRGGKPVSQEGARVGRSTEREDPKGLAETLAVHVVEELDEASREMAEDITTYIRENMPEWRKSYPGVEGMEVAVMGCVVNGPGESKYADIGISLPGTFEEPKAPVYIDGTHATTLKGEGLVDEFKELLVGYIERRYGGETRQETEPE